MSLVCWLPLLGNTNNQGLGGHTLNGSPASWSTNGKIGKCATFSGNTSNVIYNNTTDFNYTDNFSWCVWVNTNYTGSTFQYVFTNGRADAGGYGYGLQCASTSSCFVRYGSSVWNISVTGGVWTHLVFTKRGTTIKIYKNGSLYSTVTFSGTAPTYSDGNGLGLGCFHYTGNIYPYYGSINDFRIYDHCLSCKEIQEISKGLVCHYKLSNQYETGQVNKYSGDVAEGYLTGYFARTKLKDERGYNYKLTYTGTGSNNWTYMNTGELFSFTAGKKYYYSCKVRCHSTNFGLYLRASRSGNDWVTNMVNVLAKADGEWHEYVVSQIINSTYDRSGSTVTSNPTLEFYTDNLITSGKVYSADFDIKDIQVIESDCYVPFIDNSMTSTVVSDCSGYGNNGTKVGTITWSGDSARYNGSYMPTTNSSYISTTLNTSGYANSYTFSYWAKISDMNGKMAFGFSDGNRLNLYPTNSIFCWNTGDSADNPFQNSGTNVTFTSYNGAWHHYAITGNGTTTTLYIDGEKKGTAKTYKAITGTKLFLSGWDTGTSYKWTGGNISDFRLYSTCFSESDVKSLYNVSASIDKTGVLFCGEVMEN